VEGKCLSPTFARPLALIAYQKQQNVQELHLEVVQLIKYIMHVQHCVSSIFLVFHIWLVSLLPVPQSATGSTSQPYIWVYAVHMLNMKIFRRNPIARKCP
jgi:hypothetical protein